jgi:hypothetical protein
VNLEKKLPKKAIIVSTEIKTVGTKVRVITVETSNPPVTERASG